MRKNILYLSAATVLFLTTMLVTIPVAALGNVVLTPGLECLSDACDMIQTGLIANEIQFTTSDFANAIGYTPRSITITSLPPARDGTLYFGTLPVAVDQEIQIRNVSLLRFVPNGDCTDSSFRFRGDNTYSHSCTLRFTQTVNQTPTIDSASIPVSAWTQQNISMWGTLPGFDPDGDPLTYEIVTYPQKGLVSITNETTGNYRYTPYDGFIGTDSFTYRVRDCYGNYSSVQTMTVSIDEPVCQVVFADMQEHWAKNAALVMVAENAMDVYAESGQVYFRPDETITREDYLVTVMKALGAGDVEPCTTVFADHNDIATDATGYVQRAYNLGIIRGSMQDGAIYFRPKDSITRAEAAVILNAIIGADTPDVIPTFADTAAIPTWASPSLYALSNLGILQGTGDGALSPDTPVSRAQTAQMLLTVKNKMGT